MSKLGYTWYPKDFISDPDVMFMTACERGVYRDIIDLAYMSDNKIPYSLEMLAKYTNSDVETVEKVLGLKGQKKGDYWTIPSCEKRLRLANRNRTNGAKGGRPKTQTKPKQNPDGNPKVSHSVNDYETQTERQREREREIEIESEERSHARTHEEVPDSVDVKPERPWQSYSIDDLADELNRSTAWKESVCMQYSLQPNEIHPWLTRFAGHLKASGEETKNIRDAKKHFSSWLRIQLEMQKRNSKSNQSMPADNAWRFDKNIKPEYPGDWVWLEGLSRWGDKMNMNKSEKRRLGLL